MCRDDIIDSVRGMQQLIHAANRELAEVNPASAGYEHVVKALGIMSELSKISLQTVKELQQTDNQEQPLPPTVSGSKKRGRGRQKGQYLSEGMDVKSYGEIILHIFENHFRGDNFLVKNKTIPATKFMACLYKVGIQERITVDDPQKKAFCNLIAELLEGTEFKDKYHTSHNSVNIKVNDMEDNLASDTIYAKEWSSLCKLATEIFHEAAEKQAKAVEQPPL